MIDGSEKRNRQLAFELENSHVFEKRSNVRRVHNGCDNLQHITDYINYRRKYMRIRKVTV